MITSVQLLQLCLLLFYFYKDGKCLEWKVVKKVTDYGQNVTLFCKIDNCCQRNSGWDIFDPYKRTLWLDVRDFDIDSKAKYVPFTSTEGFGLTITNITKKDLRNRYRCMYGLDEGEPKILTESLTFKGPDWIVMKKVVKYGQHLTLFCNIEDCCTEVAWEVYKTTQVEKHIIDSDDKYIVGHMQDGFSLTIRHLEEKDIDIRYACKYGKRLGERKLLSEDDTFESDTNSKAKNSIAYQIITSIVMLSFAVIVFVCFWIILKRRSNSDCLDRTMFKKLAESGSQWAIKKKRTESETTIKSWEKNLEVQMKDQVVLPIKIETEIITKTYLSDTEKSIRTTEYEMGVMEMET